MAKKSMQMQRRSNSQVIDTFPLEALDMEQDTIISYRCGAFIILYEITKQISVATDVPEGKVVIFRMGHIENMRLHLNALHKAKLYSVLGTIPNKVFHEQAQKALVKAQEMLKFILSSLNL